MNDGSGLEPSSFHVLPEKGEMALLRILASLKDADFL